MFYDTIIELCKKHNVKITPLVISLGGAKSSPTNWKNGTSPNSDIVIKLAEYFNVSTDYLLLGKESKAIVLSDDERILLDSFNRLSDRGKGQIIERIKVIEENEKSITK